MKVLLLQPPINKDVICVNRPGEPFALELIAGGLEGYELDLLDLRIEPRKLWQKLDHFSPDVIAMTSLTFDVPLVKEILFQIKTRYPSITTAVGGHHATFSPEDFLEEFIDVIVCGYGDLVFKELIGAIEKKACLEEIEGIVFRANGKWHQNKKRTLPQDFDTFPFPDRQIVEKYWHQGYYGTNRFAYFSRGCPNRCSFCFVPTLNNGRFIYRQPDLFAQELSRTQGEYIWMIDENTFALPDKAHELADKIALRGIRKNYTLYTRADSIVENYDLVKKWKEIGLKKIFVGLESIREGDLLDYRKNIELKTNNAAIEILRELDIIMGAMFVLNHHYEKRDFKDLKRYVSTKNIPGAEFYVLTPFPGTKLYETQKKDIITKNYGFFDMAHPLFRTKLPLGKFYRHFLNLYFSYYLHILEETVKNCFARERGVFRKNGRKIQKYPGIIGRSIYNMLFIFIPQFFLLLFFYTKLRLKIDKQVRSLTREVKGQKALERDPKGIVSVHEFGGRQ